VDERERGSSSMDDGATVKLQGAGFVGLEGTVVVVVVG